MCVIIALRRPRLAAGGEDRTREPCNYRKRSRFRLGGVGGDHSRALHSATIAGKPMRSFRTPLDDGRPDFQCLDLGRVQRRTRLSLMRANGGMQTVATPDGIVTVAPHPAAQGAIEAAIEAGRVPASLRAEYRHAELEALQRIAPPGFPVEYMAWMAAALSRYEA